MLALVIKVSRTTSAAANNESNNRRLRGMTPGIVCRQSAVYLGAIYLVYLPTLAYTILRTMGDENNFGATLAMSILTNTLGLWIAIVYWYFSFRGSSGEIRIISMRNRQSLDSEKLTVARNDENISKTSHDDEWHQQSSSQEGERTSSDGKNSNDRDKRKSKARKSAVKKKYSFSIFDGTSIASLEDKGSKFADFLFEGDEEDVKNDESTTKFWSSCQTCNNLEDSKNKLEEGTAAA